MRGHRRPRRRAADEVFAALAASPTRRAPSSVPGRARGAALLLDARLPRARERAAAEFREAARAQAERLAAHGIRVVLTGPGPPTTSSAGADERARAGASLEDADASLLELVDHVLNKGVVVTGDVMLASPASTSSTSASPALLCAADRILPAGPRSDEPAVPLCRGRDRRRRGLAAGLAGEALESCARRARGGWSGAWRAAGAGGGRPSAPTTTPSGAWPRGCRARPARALRVPRRGRRRRSAPRSRIAPRSTPRPWSACAAASR